MRGSMWIHGLVISVLIVAGASVAWAGAPLHEAAAKGDLEAIDRLIASGISVDTLKWGAYSPLSYAAKKGKLDAVKHLVDVHGASIDIEGVNSTSPLWAAAGYNHIDVAEYLVRQGARSVVTVTYGAKRGKSMTLRDQRPNWPWDRWVREMNIERNRTMRIARDTQDQQLESERLERLEARWERDAALPATVRKDKYLLALRKKMGAGEYQDALIYFDFLQRLDVPLDPTFDVDHGELLLKTGDTEGALDKLYSYLQERDAGDAHYVRVLNLINTAEGR